MTKMQPIYYPAGDGKPVAAEQNGTDKRIGMFKKDSINVTVFSSFCHVPVTLTLLYFSVVHLSMKKTE